jgi:hypothetical protein
LYDRLYDCGVSAHGRRRTSPAGILALLTVLLAAVPSAGAFGAPAFQLDPNPHCPIGNENAINLVGHACVNEGSLLGGSAAWNSITDGAVSWEYPNHGSAPNQGPPQWSGTYSWEVPTSIPTVVGNNMSLTIAGEEKTHNPNASFCPGMAVGQDFTATPEGLYEVCAESGMKNTLVKTVSLVPKQSSGMLVLWVGIQDGPSFYYQYEFAEPTPPTTKKLHTAIHYKLSAYYARPKTKAPFYSVQIKGQGSFEFAGSAKTKRATGESAQGKVVLELRRVQSSRPITVQLKPVSVDYLRTVEPDRTIAYIVRIRYQVISSALGCLPVSSETVIVGLHHKGERDRVKFGFCGGADNTAGYEFHGQSVLLSQSESRS